MTPKPSSGARAAPAVGRARLGEVLASIAVIDVVRAPQGLEVFVGEPLIYDAAAPADLDADAVVLAVGVSASTAPDVIVAAGEAAACAVVVKVAGGDPTALVRAADEAGVAVLALPPEMTWSQAFSLVRTASAGLVDPEASGLPLGDLFALANAVAAMVGGAVTIEDRQSNVLAYSSHGDSVDEPRRQTILGRKVPDEWLARLEDAGVFRRLWAGEVVRYDADAEFDLRTRLAVAVRAGDTILGSIWVSEGDKPFDDTTDHALREAARIAALHMIRHRATDDLDRSIRGDVLRSILEGGGPVEALAYRLGVGADAAFAVLAFEPQASDEIEGALIRERALDLVALYGEAFRQRSAAAQIGRTIYVLLPLADRERDNRLVELARDIVDQAERSLGVQLRAGVGGIIDHLRDVPRSRREADEVLRALAGSPDALAVADFEAARTRVALLDLRDFASERPQLQSPRLRRLFEHDDAHGTCYIETLRAYLDSFGDIPAAARRTNVHANSFRYRLRRLIELSGIDLNDPDERLLVSLELRVRP